MKNEKGLTLVEILVSVGVFSGLLTLVAGIFVANFQMQRRTMAMQKTIGELSYAIEYMGRAIRMAQNDYDNECLVEDDPELTYGIPQDELGAEQQGIQFIDYKDECIKFFLDQDEGIIKKGVMDDSDNWTNYELTSGILNFNNFETSRNVTPDEPEKFHVDQPAVTLLLDVETMRGQSDQVLWDANIQTTITRRRLDIERYYDQN